MAKPPPRRTVSVVADARPTHVIHQLTALPKAGVRRTSDLEATNRLRIEGTRYLLEAAVEAGARRFLAGSFAMLSARDGRTVSAASAAVAVRSMETQVLEATARRAIEGVVLRYGLFYGLTVPSTVTLIDKVRKHRLPVVRSDAGQLPVINVDDAVSRLVDVGLGRMDDVLRVRGFRGHGLFLGHTGLLGHKYRLRG